MKKNLKKLCVLMAMLAISAVSYANESVIAENNTQSIQQDEDSLGGLAKGFDQQFTTDGKLHPEKLLNKRFGYPDSSDSFKIQKDSKGYFLIHYVTEGVYSDNFNTQKDYKYSDKPDGKTIVKEERIRLKLEKNVFLRALGDNNNDYAYAYDTKLKKVVIINPYNDYKIVYPVN